MKALKVWAPFANKVEIQIESRKFPMSKEPGGWWSFESPLIKHGNSYAFILDNSKPFPDPRSLWQPLGASGPSCILDHDKFIWHDVNWQAPSLTSAIIYELHVGTFSDIGTFDGIIQHLDYLKNLGITHIEIMPINSFSGSRGWGYDGVDIYAPQEIYGGPEGFKRLINACHDKKIAVILDVVYNHLGSEENYLMKFGPYFTDRYSLPWGTAINFDGPFSNEVRRFFCDNAIMWFKDYHVDVLRIDAVHAIFDNSPIHFLQQLSNEVKELQNVLGRNLYLIIESDLNESRYLRSSSDKGYGIDAQWNDDFHHALHSLLTNERFGYYSDFGKLAHLAKALINAFVYDGCYSSFRKRNHGSKTSGLFGNKFIGFLQNHDQIGNRPQGDRLSKLVNINLIKIGSALVFTSSFIPMIFQGEEWGASTPFLYFTDFHDKELGESVLAGRIKELSAFGWQTSNIPNPQDPKTFLSSKINWNELETEPHKSLLIWYKNLIALRSEYQDFKDFSLDKLQIIFDENEKWLVIKRGKIIVVVNFTLNTKILSCAKLKLKDVKIKIILSSVENNYIENDNIFLEAESVIIGIIMN